MKLLGLFGLNIKLDWVITPTPTDGGKSETSAESQSILLCLLFLFFYFKSYQQNYLTRWHY